MTGTLNINDNEIMTDYAPTSKHDVVNNKYVDTTVKDVNIGSKVIEAGDVMTGDFNLGESKLKISYVPTLDEDAVNKNYVDSLPKAVREQSINSKLNTYGGEMTKNLDMGVNKILTHAIPRYPNDVINKTLMIL